MQTQENELKQALNQDDVNAKVEQNAQGDNQELNADEALASDAAASANVKAENDQDNNNELVAQIEALKLQLKAATDAAAKDKDQFMRAVAEAQNAKRRAEADVEKERKFGIEKMVKALIPVVDSLDMALSMSDRNDPSTKATLDGVESTLKLFLKELASFGVERIDPQGMPFDPNFHQAISMAPSADVPVNHVLSVMQKGFVLNGRVVRPAMVIVAKAAEQEKPSSTSVNIEA